MSLDNASVTKGFMVSCAVLSILVGIFDVKHYFHLQLVPHISSHHQYWRLFSHHIVFLNSSDLFLAEVILFNVGVHVERRFGSIKYASFAAIITLLSIVLEFLALLLFHGVGLNYIALGPSALIFGTLYQYTRLVPSTYSYRIFGLPLNNKSLIYLLTFQMSISRLPGSAVAALIGILSGQIYRSDLANLKAYRIPPMMVRFSTSYILPLLGSSHPQRLSNRALPDDAWRNMRSETLLRDEVVTTAHPSSTPSPPPLNPNTGTSVVREWVDELTGRTERTNAGLRVPSEAEVIQVTSMFPSIDREVVVGALQRSQTVEGAVETLLVSQ